MLCGQSDRRNESCNASLPSTRGLKVHVEARPNPVLSGVAEQLRLSPRHATTLSLSRPLIPGLSRPSHTSRSCFPPLLKLARSEPRLELSARASRCCDAKGCDCCMLPTVYNVGCSTLTSLPSNLYAISFLAPAEPSPNTRQLHSKHLLDPQNRHRDNPSYSTCAQGHEEVPAGPKRARCELNAEGRGSSRGAKKKARTV